LVRTHLRNWRSAEIGALTKAVWRFPLDATETISKSDFSNRGLLLLPLQESRRSRVPHSTSFQYYIGEATQPLQFGAARYRRVDSHPTRILRLNTNSYLAECTTATILCYYQIARANIVTSYDQYCAVGTRKQDLILHVANPACLCQRDVAARGRGYGKSSSLATSFPCCSIRNLKKAKTCAPPIKDPLAPVRPVAPALLFSAPASNLTLSCFLSTSVLHNTTIDQDTHPEIFPFHQHSLPTLRA